VRWLLLGRFSYFSHSKVLEKQTGVFAKYIASYDSQFYTRALLILSMVPGHVT
jgi:hypothetical protein